MKRTDGMSPALRILDAVWHGDGTAASGRSRRRLNCAMQDALTLAIESQAKFGRDDFRAIEKHYRPGYWLHAEGAYARAIEKGNLSAAMAIEAHLGRRPFLIRPHLPRSGEGKIRLHIGSAFAWYDQFKVEVESAYVAKVTSFDDASGSLVACAYQCPAEDRHGNLPPGCAPEMIYDDGAPARDGEVLYGYEIDASDNPGMRPGSRVFRRWTITHADFKRREQAWSDYHSGRRQVVDELTDELAAAH